MFKRNCAYFLLLFSLLCAQQSNCGSMLARGADIFNRVTCGLGVLGGGAGVLLLGLSAWDVTQEMSSRKETSDVAFREEPGANLLIATPVDPNNSRAKQLR